MYFLQISDTHFLEDYKVNRDIFHEAFVAMTSPMKKLELIAKEVTVPLDFILHCGDITHAGQKRDYQLMREKLEELFPKVPVIATAGNHDHRHMVQEVFYGEVIKPFVHNQKIGDLRILSFDNTTTRYDKGEISAEVANWLYNQLQGDPDQKTLLVTHHHCMPGQVSMDSCTIDTNFHKVMTKPNVVALLTGHTHSHFESKLGDLPYFTAPPLSFQAKELGDGFLDVCEAGGYHLFSFKEGILALEKHGDLGLHNSVGKAHRPN